MPHFLAVYVGTPQGRERSGWEALDDARRQALESQGMQAWGEWMNRNGHRIVYAGGPLGTTKRVDANGVDNVSNNLAGFVVVEADSLEAAAELFRDHPHFSIFPGEAVEVMACLPVPGGGL